MKWVERVILTNLVIYVCTSFVNFDWLWLVHAGTWLLIDRGFFLFMVCFINVIAYGFCALHDIEKKLHAKTE